MKIKKCKIFKKSDPKKKTVKEIAVEIIGGASSEASYSFNGYNVEGSNMVVKTETDFAYISGDYNIEIPNFGEFKIIGFQKIQINQGQLRARFRYTLTLAA